jgi:alkylhydroperoxidase/carboxymuconolactone decarboxylase family protein YurZ
MSLLAPNAVAGFIALDKTTHLDAKTRELIAVAIAVTTRCDGCPRCAKNGPDLRPAPVVSAVDFAQ